MVPHASRQESDLKVGAPRCGSLPPSRSQALTLSEQRRGNDKGLVQSSLYNLGSRHRTGRKARLVFKLLREHRISAHYSGAVSDLSLHPN